MRLGLILLVACAHSQPAPPPAPATQEGRRGTTNSPEAQRLFQEGLLFVYAFHHDQAIRSFSAAAERDPECAMAHWGVALANGPHINNPAMDPEHAQAAWAALGRAQQAKHASPLERALIAALSKRYAD